MCSIALSPLFLNIVIENCIDLVNKIVLVISIVHIKNTVLVNNHDFSQLSILHSSFNTGYLVPEQLKSA